MADIERRRELLVKLVAVLDELAKSYYWARCAHNIAAGALDVGDLDDDGVWTTLLEMVLEEVVDDGANE